MQAGGWWQCAECAECAECATCGRRRTVANGWVLVDDEVVDFIDDEDGVVQLELRASETRVEERIVLALQTVADVAVAVDAFARRETEFCEERCVRGVVTLEQAFVVLKHVDVLLELDAHEHSEHRDDDWYTRGTHTVGSARDDETDRRACASVRRTADSLDFPSPVFICMIRAPNWSFHVSRFS